MDKKSKLLSLHRHLQRGTRLLLALLMLCTSSALWAQSAGRSVTISFTNEPASSALSKVEKMSGRIIQFNYQDVDFRVTLSVKNQEAIEVVRQIIKGHPLIVEDKGKSLVISRNAQKQVPATIRGRILDENGEPSENPDGLIPKSWAWTTVAGDARQILIGIVTAQDKNNPIYARLTEEGNVLEFNHDTFGDDGCFSPELCEYRKLSDREWIDFLADQFDISGTSAEGMLCSMKRWKKEHSFDAGSEKSDFPASG